MIKNLGNKMQKTQESTKRPRIKEETYRDKQHNYRN